MELCVKAKYQGEDYGEPCSVVAVVTLLIMIFAMNSVKISQALSSPIRYRILLILAQKANSYKTEDTLNKTPPGLCVFELMDELGLKQSKVSYHIKELNQAGLITEKTQGKCNVYCINSSIIKDYIGLLIQDINANK